MDTKHLAGSKSYSLVVIVIESEFSHLVKLASLP